MPRRECETTEERFNRIERNILDLQIKTHAIKGAEADAASAVDFSVQVSHVTIRKVLGKAEVALVLAEDESLDVMQLLSSRHLVLRAY